MLPWCDTCLWWWLFPGSQNDSDINLLIRSFNGFVLGNSCRSRIVEEKHYSFYNKKCLLFFGISDLVLRRKDCCWCWWQLTEWKFWGNEPAWHRRGQPIVCDRNDFGSSTHSLWLVYLDGILSLRGHSSSTCSDWTVPAPPPPWPPLWQGAGDRFRIVDMKVQITLYIFHRGKPFFEQMEVWCKWNIFKNKPTCYSVPSDYLKTFPNKIWDCSL